MADKVSTTASVPRLDSPPASLADVGDFLRLAMRTILEALRKHAIRLNAAFMNDGTDALTAPIKMKSYAVADLPAAAIWEGAVIYVPNESGGKTLVFSDGTNWRRAQDRVIVS